MNKEGETVENREGGNEGKGVPESEGGGRMVGWGRGKRGRGWGGGTGGEEEVG